MTEVPSDPPISWAQRVENLRAALGRDPTLDEMLLITPLRDMTPDESRAQAESWQRAMRETGDPRFD